MAKIRKKSMSLFTAAALFICFTADVTAAPDKNSAVNNDIIYSNEGNQYIYISEEQFLYNFNGENPGVSICGYVGKETELEFPILIKGKEVSAIDNGAFENDDRITSVTIPYSIKSIGENSFNGCKHLTTVSLSSGVSQFYKVFCDCPAITSITFPNGVVDISESFRKCKKLSYIKFARSVTTVDEHSFSDCVSLKKIEWLGGIKTLGDAFDGCTALQSVTVPEGVIIINGSFDGCKSLQTIALPETLLYITGGFSDCAALEEVILPKKLLFVNDAFNNCEKLSSVAMGDSTKISDTAFLSCPRLVIKKGNRILWQTLGWLALAVIMLLTGFLIYRKLTSLADRFAGKKKRTRPVKQKWQKKRKIPKAEKQ